MNTCEQCGAFSGAELLCHRCDEADLARYRRQRIIVRRYDPAHVPDDMACLPFDCWVAARYRKDRGPFPDVRLRRVS